MMASEEYKILLVEDDEIDQMAFKRMVTKNNLNYNVTVVPSVSKTKEALDDKAFDLVIADYNLTDGTAFDVMDLITDIPVIFATGAGNEEIAIKAMRAGAHDYLIKDHGRKYLEVIPMVIDKAVKHDQAEKKLTQYHDNLENLVAERTDELIKEKELLGTTLSSMSDAVIAMDTDKKIILFNRIAETMTALKFKEVAGKNAEDILRIVDEKTREPVTDIFNIDAEPDSEKIENRECAIIDINENISPVALSVSTIKHDDGTIMGMVLVLRNVTKERKVEQMKTGFVSSVSHELRTPLTSIKAFTATILRDPNMSDETRTEFLHIIDEESNRLANLIEDLLEVSRIESGTVNTEFKAVDITELMNQVLPPLEPLAEKKNISIEKNFADELPELTADADKLKSVITNLVNNAIKFTPDGGKIIVKTEPKDDQLVISISDNGMGIPKDDVDKVFERFHRVHRPGTEIQGTGLGLSIVKNIVEMHEGTIELQSQVDKGTTFTIYLPLAAATVNA